MIRVLEETVNHAYSFSLIYMYSRFLFYEIYINKYIYILAKLCSLNTNQIVSTDSCVQRQIKLNKCSSHIDFFLVLGKKYTKNIIMALVKIIFFKME